MVAVVSWVQGDGSRYSQSRFKVLMMGKRSGNMRARGLPRGARQLDQTRQSRWLMDHGPHDTRHNNGPSAQQGSRRARTAPPTAHSTGESSQLWTHDGGWNRWAGRGWDASLRNQGSNDATWIEGRSLTAKTRHTGRGDSRGRCDRSRGKGALDRRTSPSTSPDQRDTLEEATRRSEDAGRYSYSSSSGQVRPPSQELSTTERQTRQRITSQSTEVVRQDRSGVEFPQGWDVEPGRQASGMSGSLARAWSEGAANLTARGPHIPYDVEPGWKIDKDKPDPSKLSGWYNKRELRRRFYGNKD